METDWYELDYTYLDSFLGQKRVAYNTVLFYRFQKHQLVNMGCILFQV